jgi:hypothetical protein
MPCSIGHSNAGVQHCSGRSDILNFFCSERRNYILMSALWILMACHL